MDAVYVWDLKKNVLLAAVQSLKTRKTMKKHNLCGGDSSQQRRL